MQQSTLEAQNISVVFPGVKALDGVNYTLRTNEISALVGANGAGKSTLMKVLAGANPGYTGQLLIDNEPVEVRDPIAAQRLGIQIVYQEVDTALIPTLSVAENLVMNDLVLKGNTVMNWAAVRKEARKALERVHLTNIDERTLVQNLTLAQKQMVLIARAANSDCRFLILDEPTAPLSDTETKELFRVVRDLVETEHIGVVFISHRLNEILQICHSYSVLRNGQNADEGIVTSETTTNEIIQKMLGRELNVWEKINNEEIGELLLEVKNLAAEEGQLQDIALTVHRGEIVGIAGLVGAGKSELCKTLFGAYKQLEGEIQLAGKPVKVHSPAQAVKNGLALVPEERRKEGVLVQEDVAFNLSAASLGDFCKMSFIQNNKVNQNANKYVDELQIKTPTIQQKVANLSGGNQQKVVVGKWLAADSEVYIFDEPTKGVDVGAKEDIFRLIREIAKRGKGVIYATSENAELLGLTDKLYVMYGGKIMKELKTANTTDEEIMYYAVGGDEQKEAEHE